MKMDEPDETKEPALLRKPIARRKKGTRSRRIIGPKKKTHSKFASSSESSTTESSVLTSETDTQVDVGLSKEPSSSCLHSVLKPHLHLCSESDGFSETATEFQTETTETESEIDLAKSVGSQSKKRPKKTSLSYKAKGSSKKAAAEKAGSSKDSEEIFVDICGSDTEDIKCKDNSPNLDQFKADVVSSGPSNRAESSLETNPEPESTKDSKETLKLLLSNLTLWLPKGWSLDVIRDTIVRLISLNESPNAAVKSSVFWNCDNNSWGLFIHGKIVPKDSKIFRAIGSLPEEGNLGSIADFLFRVVKQVMVAKVCPGIKEHTELWRDSRGYIDNISSDDSPCYRSWDCHLTVTNNPVCINCRNESMKLEREQKRKEREDTKSSHVADKHLSVEEMKIKKDSYKELFKKEKLRADRLEEKVDRLKVKLDAALRDELSAILIKNQHKMTALQLCFWQSQREALAATDKRGIRWHPMVIRIALHIHSTSPENYEYFRETGILQLPSARRLYDYSHFIEAKEGCQAEIITDIKNRMNACGSEGHFSFVNLMFDEMHIRAGLVTQRSTGELIGFTNLSETEKELQKLQEELGKKNYKPKLAKKVLVYLVEGVTASNVKDIVAIFSTDDLSAVQLYNRTWDVIYHLEEGGIKVISLTCDRASTNRKFFRMHESLDKSCKSVYCTKNLKAGDSRPLFFIIDPPHLLKTVRNCIANSFSHRNTRKLWKNREFLSWQVYEQVYEITKKEKFKEHKLTKAHIKLSSFSCMTVSYATQVLSNSVAQCIEDLSSHEKMELLDTNELVKLTRLMNKFFDCFNAKEDFEKEANDPTRNPDLAAYRSSSDPRLDFLEHEFLKYFEDWKEDVVNRPGIYTDSERSRMIISHQSLDALVITVKSFIGVTKFMLNIAKAPMINARVFNQDPLEQYFNKMRRKHGDNRQTFLQSVLHSRLELHAEGHAALASAKGNTSVERKRDLKVDPSPLAVRKKPKPSTE